MSQSYVLVTAVANYRYVVPDYFGITAHLERSASLLHVLLETYSDASLR